MLSTTISLVHSFQIERGKAAEIHYEFKLKISLNLVRAIVLNLGLLSSLSLVCTEYLMHKNSTNGAKLEY